MNKWQKIINQIAKDDFNLRDEAFNNFRKNRINLRIAIKQTGYITKDFEAFVSFKNWNKGEGIMIRSFIKQLDEVIVGA